MLREMCVPIAAGAGPQVRTEEEVVPAKERGAKGKGGTSQRGSDEGRQGPTASKAMYDEG
jgi:hypothetical protein